MDWAGKFDFYRMLDKKGKIKEADRMPEVSEGESLVLNMFSELSTGRSMGMSVGPIPITLFWEAQKRYKLSDLAIYTMQQIDNAYIRIINGRSSSPG